MGRRVKILAFLAAAVLLSESLALPFSCQLIRPGDDAALSHQAGSHHQFQSEPRGSGKADSPAVLIAKRLSRPDTDCAYCTFSSSLGKVFLTRTTLPTIEPPARLGTPTDVRQPAWIFHRSLLPRAPPARV